MEQKNKMGWHLTDSLLDDLNRCCEIFHIRTKQRIRHFISQCSHESNLGADPREKGTGKSYNGRKDLGNIYPGDRPHFKGGGFIQLTGCANYQAFANYIGDQNTMKGVDYVAVHYSWSSAGYFWDRIKRLNDKVDKGATVE